MIEQNTFRGCGPAVVTMPPAPRFPGCGDAVCFTEQPGPEFAHLTFPRFRHLLSGNREDVTAIGAQTEGSSQPVGLALVFWPKTPAARLLSITVERARRGEGIARALLGKVESAARARGSTSLMTVYSSRLPRREDFEHFLSRSAWPEPVLEEMRTAGYAAAVAAEMDRLEVSHRPYLPDGASAEPWSSVTESERGEVDALVAAIEFQAPLAPSLYLEKAHPELSLVLRHNGKIAGWVFGERDSDDFCHYGCGYVAPGLRRRGALIGLIREVCRRQAAMFGSQSVAQLSTTPAVPGMPRFMRQRLGPCALWYDEIWKASKYLTSCDSVLDSEASKAAS